VKEQFLKPFEERKLPIVFLRDPSVDKDRMARELRPRTKRKVGWFVPSV
jgi:cytochrome c oxidase assembly protein Cox11